jgi:mannose-1-phosphate guanylyltransferase
MARCGIVLSAGDGTRVRDWIYRARGHDLPKQYVNFFGNRSMLEHTVRRAEKLIPAARLFIVIAREHLKFSDVRRQIAWRPRETLVIQPQNRNTAPGILLPLLHLYNAFPEAAVAVFPSDHFVLEEDLFMEHVERAFRVVEREGSRIVLLGVTPPGPDPEYEYIVPGEAIDDGGLGARRVELFVEKPGVETVKKIIEHGALCNTLVVVFRCQTLLTIIRRTALGLYRSFEPILEAIGTPGERRTTERLYRNLPPLNFSTGVLEALPFELRSALAVLPVPGVTWDDWGTPLRLSRGVARWGQFRET